MAAIVISYTLFLTSQFDVIFTFANQLFGEFRWHNLHIILCAFSLLVLKCFTITHKLSALQIRRLEQSTAFNDKTERFITAKISGNVLKRGVEQIQCYVSAVHNCKYIRLRIKTVEWNTHLTLREVSSQLQKHQAAQMSRRISVEQRRLLLG